jgi:hypothetical protein
VPYHAPHSRPPTLNAPGSEIMPGRNRNLSLRLTRTLNPNNWPALVTLGDAVHYLSEFGEARRKEPQWAYAMAALDRAALSGDENDIAAATRAVAAVLARE